MAELENSQDTGSKMEKRKYKARISRKKKVDIVLELLRGESLEELSRNHKVAIHELNQWRETFVSSGESGFKTSPKTNKREAELERIIGRQQMEIELLKKKMRPYGKAPVSS